MSESFGTLVSPSGKFKGTNFKLHFVYVFSVQHEDKRMCLNMSKLSLSWWSINALLKQAKTLAPPTDSQAKVLSISLYFSI